MTPYKESLGSKGFRAQVTSFVLHVGCLALCSVPNSESCWPCLFEITLQITERVGSCYCAIDGGHMIMTQYSQELDPSNHNGLSLAPVLLYLLYHIGSLI